MKISCSTKNRMKLRVFFISVLVLFAVGLIWNYKYVDYSSAYQETFPIQLSKDTATYCLQINKQKNMYLDTVKIRVIKQDRTENIQVSMNLSDQYGYLLYSQVLDFENNNIFHPQAEIYKNENYSLELSVFDMDQNDLEAVVTYCQYRTLPGIVKAVTMIFAFFIVSTTYLICMESDSYLKLKKNVILICNKKIPPGFGEYIMWSLLFLIPFLTLMYGDTRAFVHYEVNFWKCIKEGGGIEYFYEYSNKMLEYYRNNQIGGAYEVIYDFPVYIILGIWGFPLWLVCSVFNLEETSHFGTMIYGKSIYLVFLPVTAYIIYRICKNIGISVRNSKWASFLFLSSVVVFVDVGIMGQLDILGIPFTLLGIYYFQKRCTWKFVFFFAVASSFKQFPLFAFIPLLLLIEKRFLKIAADTLLVVVFTFLLNMPFPKNTVAMEVKGEIREKFIETFLGAKLPIYNGIVPVIVVVIGVICICCYLKELKSQKEVEQFSVFVPLLVMFVLFTSFDSNPYWFIHLAPFLAIMMMYNAKNFNKLILFETMGMLCLVLSQFSTNYWCFNTNIGEGMLLDILLGRPDSYITIEKLLPYISWNTYAPVCFAGYMLAIGAFIYISRPGYIEQADPSVRWQAVLRLFLNAGISIVPTFLYIVSVFVFGG